LSVLEQIVELLKGHRIEFNETEHAPTLTSEDSSRERGDDLASGAKAIVYKIQDEFKLFVFPADQKMDTKKIKAYFKEQGLRVKKTRFATPEELDSMTGLVPGSVPPFGQPILNLSLCVDPSLGSNEWINFNAGSLTHSIRMSYEDYIRISGATIFDFIQNQEQE